MLDEVGGWRKAAGKGDEHPFWGLFLSARRDKGPFSLNYYVLATYHKGD